MSLLPGKLHMPHGAPRLPTRWVWIIERSAGIGMFVGWSERPTLGLIAGIMALAALHVIIE